MHYERVRSDLQRARLIWYRRQRRNVAWRKLSLSRRHFRRE